MLDLLTNPISLFNLFLFNFVEYSLGPLSFGNTDSLLSLLLLIPPLLLNIDLLNTLALFNHFFPRLDFSLVLPLLPLSPLLLLLSLVVTSLIFNSLESVITIR